MINKGQFRKETRTQKDYSSAFKLQVADEVEKGELNQVNSAVAAIIIRKIDLCV